MGKRPRQDELDPALQERLEWLSRHWKGAFKQCSTCDWKQLQSIDFETSSASTTTWSYSWWSGDKWQEERYQRWRTEWAVLNVRLETVAKDIAKISRKLQRKGMNQAETFIFLTVLLTGNSDSRVSDGRCRCPPRCTHIFLSTARHVSRSTLAQGSTHFACFKTLFIIASHGLLRQKVSSKVEELEEERNRGRETRQEMNRRGELNSGGSSHESSRSPWEVRLVSWYLRVGPKRQKRMMWASHGFARCSSHDLSILHPTFSVHSAHNASFWNQCYLWVRYSAGLLIVWRCGRKRTLHGLLSKQASFQDLYWRQQWIHADQHCCTTREFQHWGVFFFFKKKKAVPEDSNVLHRQTVGSQRCAASTNYASLEEFGFIFKLKEISARVRYDCTIILQLWVTDAEQQSIHKNRETSAKWWISCKCWKKRVKNTSWSRS